MTCMLKIRNHYGEEEKIPAWGLLFSLKRGYISKVYPEEVPVGSISFEEIEALKEAGVKIIYDEDRKSLHIRFEL